MDCSMRSVGKPCPSNLPKFAQIHVHWVGDFSNHLITLISFRIDWFDLLVIQGIQKSLLLKASHLKASVIRCSAFFMVQFSHLYMTTGKPIVLTVQTFVGKVMLPLNMLSRFVIAFFQRRNHLLISWLQSSSTVIWEPEKRKSVTASTFSPSIWHEAEKAMAPHSSTLAWKIPWAEEPGRLQSMGLLRVGHEWAISLSCIGDGNGNPLQCSCLENPRDRGAWWAAIYRVTQSQTRLKWLISIWHEETGTPGFWMLSFKPVFFTLFSHPYQKALQFLFTFCH